MKERDFHVGATDDNWVCQTEKDVRYQIIDLHELEVIKYLDVAKIHDFLNMESAGHVSISTSGRNDLENSAKWGLERLEDHIAESESPGGTDTGKSRCSSSSD